MKNGTWLLLSLLCVLIVGLVVERFAVYCRDERKKERKKTKNTSLFVYGFFFFVDTCKSVAGTGYIFSGCKKTKREYIN